MKVIEQEDYVSMTYFKWEGKTASLSHMLRSENTDAILLHTPFPFNNTDCSGNLIFV